MVLHGFRSDPIIAILRHCTYIATMVAVLCALWIPSALAQNSAGDNATVADPQPQVQVLILQVDPSGAANVALTYPGTESVETAQSDIVEIGARTGWQISNPIMTDNPPSTPERPPMTSVEFTVSNALHGPTSSDYGGFPVEPLIVALKRFSEMELVFATRPDFQFRGLTNHEDDYVKIHLREGGQTYTYRVDVKRSDFDSLNLPVVINTAPEAQPTARGGSVILPLIISLGIGSVVWLLIYLKKRRLE